MDMYTNKEEQEEEEGERDHMKASDLLSVPSGTHFSLNQKKKASFGSIFTTMTFPYLSELSAVSFP